MQQWFPPTTMVVYSRKVQLPWTYVCSFHMSFIRLHRLSVLWKNWMFNQEPEHVFQVENSKDNEENILQREVPLRQSRRRYRKINQRGERQTITDNVDSSSYMSVSLLSLGPSPAAVMSAWLAGIFFWWQNWWSEIVHARHFWEHFFRVDGQWSGLDWNTIGGSEGGNWKKGFFGLGIFSWAL